MADFNSVSESHSLNAAKRVLIVDDSLAMRAWLRTILAADPRLKIVGEACDAVEARDFLRANEADVMTLDIEMPGMSGLEFLTRLMRARPMPVVMLSSLTTKGSDAAIQALSRGAIDCMLKPSDGYDQALSKDICERVYQAACTKAPMISRSLAEPTANHAPRAAYTAGVRQPCRRGSLILIGASTGGVSALEAVLPYLDPQGPPVVIVQHMPGNFLKSFSERLARDLPQNVYLAREGEQLMRGDVVLAPGDGKHTQVVRRSNGWYCTFVENDPPSLHCPSVDHLFHSAVSEAKNITAVILTGLGRDGADGMFELFKAGAKTIGQDEDTSVVYGMPRAAHALGAVQEQLPIERIGAAARERADRRRTARSATAGSSSV
ncbi:MAG: chemotaxis-specific protein-glutamate methyltransferase CheB [Roseobacter sp.]